jgi:hypothetical protein
LFRDEGKPVPSSSDFKFGGFFNPYSYIKMIVLFLAGFNPLAALGHLA